MDRFAAITGAAITENNGHYTAAKPFGPIDYTAVATSSARMAAHCAEASYHGCVEPESRS